MKKIFLLVVFAMLLLIGCANIDRMLYETDKDDLVSANELPAFQKDWYKTSAGNKEHEAGNYYEIIDGVLYGYGENSCGQLGLGIIDNCEVRYTQGVRIASDVVHVAIAQGGWIVIYLDQEGNLYGIGCNNSGQLGQKSENEVHDYSSTCSISKPVLIMTDVEYAEVGNQHTVILKKDGTLWTLGSNSNGQLGDGKQGTSKEIYKNEPPLFSYIPVCIMDHVIYVTSTSYTSAAIREDGSLWMWGDNSHGEIGNGEKGNGYPTISICIVPKPIKILNYVSMVWFKYSSVHGVNTFAYENMQGNTYAWGSSYKTTPEIIEKK